MNIKKKFTKSSNEQFSNDYTNYLNHTTFLWLLIL